jgi:Tfp pilus assembly protein PilF
LSETDVHDRPSADAVEALKRGDFAAAFSLADTALRGGAATPALFNVRALCQQEKGRYAEALADFECARAAFPHDAALLHSIGLCLFHLGQFRRAANVLDRSVTIAPQSAETHYLRALALQAAGEIEAAERALERTLALAPDHVDATTRLAAIREQKGHAPDATRLAERALSLDPDRADAALVLVRTEIEKKDYASAEHRLRASLENPDFTGSPRIAALGLLGDVLDFQDRPGEAFAMYNAANDACRSLYAPEFTVGRALDNVRGIVAWLERANPWPPTEPAALPAEAPAAHVFLLGFMRSGTTLLESILASNPQTVASDEGDFLRDAAQTFLGSDAGLDRLALLGKDELARWRLEYWRGAFNKMGSLAGRTFIDKMPFNSVRLPLIAKLFPDARVIFAVRDPRDVVLSVFRNRFVVQSDTFEFLRLEDCAQYYDAVMRLAMLCFAKLPLHVYQVAYEDMVEKFDETVRAICAFAGVAWDDAMRDFRRGTRAVNIASVSAAQVRRGLYKGAIGQWRRYAGELEPVFPVLEPWIGKLGYPPQ